MSLTMIRLQCIDKTLQPIALPKLTSGGKRDIGIEFTFDDSWKGYAKTVTFYRDKALIHHATMTFDTVAIPWSVAYEPGTIYVGVFGVNADGSVRTSEVLPLDFEQGAPTGSTAAEPAPDIYQQLLAAYGNMEAAAAEERARLDGLVGGETPDDAEILDARTTADGLIHAAAGAAVRDQANRARSLASKLSLYDLDVVREHMGLQNLCGIETIAGQITDATKTWQYVVKTIPLRVGTYTVVVRDLNVPADGYFAIAASPTGQKYLKVTEPGVYTMKVYDDEDNYNPVAVPLLLQMSQSAGVPVGVYHVGGLAIYEGDITIRPAFPETLIGADKKLDKQVGKNLFDKNSPDIVMGRFLGGAGALLENEYSPDYYATGYIPVEADTVYALTDYKIGGAHIVFYDERKIVISGMDGGQGLVPAGGIFTTPAGVAYVRLSGNIANINTNQLEKGDRITFYEEYVEYAPAGDNKRRLDQLDEKLTLPATEAVKLGALSTGGSMVIKAPNAKNHHAISFSAKVDSFSSITISHGKAFPYCSAFAVIDATHVHVYAYRDKEVKLAEYAHGLTISGYVRATIHVAAGFTAELKLATASGVFAQTIEWNGSRGDVMVESQGSTLTDCVLSFYMDGLRRPVWLFGDSYLDYWPKLLVSWGYSDFYMDGYSGRDSAAALESLQKCLQYAAPQRLVWCMGMNNADAGAVNYAWNTAYETVKQLCEQHGIELILTTVPNVPGRDHSYKNDIVRASGFHYVDFCEGVGADKSTAWIDGLQSGDGVHPTERGTIALATRALLDAPELTARGADGGNAADIDRLDAEIEKLKEEGVGGGTQGDGGYYKPSVDMNGNLSWQASKSGMPSVASVNIKGQPGKYYIPKLSQDGYLSFTPSDGEGQAITFTFSLKGAPGQPGHTPVKGIDYWTDLDKEVMVSEVMALLNASGTVTVTVDENKNIKLSGNLEDGAYTLKYENADGSTTDICTLNVSGGTGEPDLPDGSDEPDGPANLFVASTCALNKRINSSGVEKDQDYTFLTDYIDIGDCLAKGGTNQIHFRGFWICAMTADDVTSTGNTHLASGAYRGINYYDAAGTFLGQKADYYVETAVKDENGDYVITLDATKTTATKIRVVGTLNAALTNTDQLKDCIITLNELITD